MPPGGATASGLPSDGSCFPAIRLSAALGPRISGVLGTAEATVGESLALSPVSGSVPVTTVDVGKPRDRVTTLRAVLSWDTGLTDVDLHVKDSQGRETYYQNKTGIPNSALDVDDMDGYGPENFSLTRMEPDTSYKVFLHYYASNGRGPRARPFFVAMGARLS